MAPSDDAIYRSRAAISVRKSDQPADVVSAEKVPDGKRLSRSASAAAIYAPESDEFFGRRFFGLCLCSYTLLDSSSLATARYTYDTGNEATGL